MFESVNFERSTAFWLCLSFALTSAVFISALVWTMMMTPRRRNHLASLPLDDSERPANGDARRH